MKGSNRFIPWLATLPFHTALYSKEAYRLLMIMMIKLTNKENQNQISNQKTLLKSKEVLGDKQGLISTTYDAVVRLQFKVKQKAEKL